MITKILITHSSYALVTYTCSILLPQPYKLYYIGNGQYRVTAVDEVYIQLVENELRARSEAHDREATS